MAMEFLKSRLRAIVYAPGTTPIDWRLFSILFLSMLCLSLSITILFPFLPAMVKSFGISDEEAGYYAGLVASSMFIGRVATCYFWGWLADKIGRRPVLLLSLALLTASMVAFGLSTSLYMAIFTRFFAGISNGLIGTVKAIASEVCDNTNQAIGISVVITAWNMGLIVGPAVGGYLAEPAEKYPNVFPKGSFFDQFAFFLPCLFNCVFLLITFSLGYFYLQETLVKRDTTTVASEPGELPMQSTVSLEGQDDSNEQRLLEDSEKYSTQVTSSQENREVEIFMSDASNSEREKGESCLSGCQHYRCCRIFHNSNLGILLRNRNTLLAIGVYALYSAVIIGYDELFSLWAATQSKHGGLGFSTDQIGTVLLCVAAPVLVLQVWLFPKFERRLGAKRVFQFSCIVVGITIFSVCWTNTYHERSKVLWPLLLVILLPMKLTTGCGFSSTAIFVNNSVPNELLASVNGLGMTAAALCRAIAPVIVGSSFAWSISEGFKLGFPLNEHFAFAILVIITVLSILLSCLLPEGLNRRYVTAERV
ncbi:unnamed protein product [Porites evermanni]|uniref:Major facilitator superfamily (MFS) profile domain-containing protein n=1 Tax=Porites evermanni TaxID=104178 RepID=A0ABN8LVM2_9CNID|nr:unnamed protein product [Porites evermanni]